MESDGTGLLGFTRAEADLSMYLVELGGGYGVWEKSYGEIRDDGSCNQARLDLLRGGRYTRLEMDLDLKVGNVVSERGNDTEEWVDPFVGGMIRWSPFNRFESFVRADMGGFGAASDFAWNVVGSVGVHLMKNLSLMAGYRVYDVDYSHGGFKLDAQMKGPWAALTLAF